jgi:hypothetical protein
MRNEEARAAGRLKTIFKIMGSDLHSDVALPVTFVPPRIRSFMPTGRCHCVRSPARKRIERRGRRKESGEKEKVRNEESCAAGLKTI